MSAPAGALDFTPSPELYPFESRWFESEVGPVHFIDEGSGRALLLLHGNPTWSFLYRHIIKELRDSFRCVAVDLPGFGLSVRPAGYGYTPGEHATIVRALIDHLGLNDFIVMGQDWGGPIGLWVAASAPERVHGLVMGNTWFWPVDRRSMKLFSLIMSSPPLQWAILHRNLFVKRIMPLSMARKLSREERSHYLRVQPSAKARKGVAIFPREIRAARPWLEKLAERVPEALGSKPLVLVWGMRDIGFRPKEFLPRWQATFPDAPLVELPAAKHYIQEDAPAEIARAIREHFQ